MKTIQIIPIYADKVLEVVAKGTLSTETETDFMDTDGNYYAKTTAVAVASLRKTDKTYTCPYKGLCYYWDLIDESSQVLITDFAWVYEQPKAGWEHIAGRFGFYHYDNANYQIVVTEQ